MKIILELPDNTLCMFLNFIMDDGHSMTMQNQGVGQREMFDGNRIVVKETEIKND